MIHTNITGTLWQMVPQCASYSKRAACLAQDGRGWGVVLDCEVPVGITCVFIFLSFQYSSWHIVDTQNYVLNKLSWNVGGWMP